MNRGNRSTANRESDVNALAGVRSPPSKVNIPNEITVTTTGMLFSIKLLNCKTREKGQENNVMGKMQNKGKRSGKQKPNNVMVPWSP